MHFFNLSPDPKRPAHENQPSDGRLPPNPDEYIAVRLKNQNRIGPYLVKNFIARGSNSLIFTGTDPRGEYVALKLGAQVGGGRLISRLLDISNHRFVDRLSPDERPAEAVFLRSGEFKIDFLEATKIDELIKKQHQILTRAVSPYMVGLRDPELQYFEDRPVLVMEYARGKTLREKIRNLEGIRLSWFLDITRGLLKLNESGRMDAHRDLKPENIIIKPSGLVRMMDPAPHPDNFNGILVTTPHYNPLLLKDSKADVMAIGVMLYELLTGILPFVDVPYKHAARSGSKDELEELSLSFFLSYPLPHDLNRNVPRELEIIIYRCLTVPKYGLEDLEVDLIKILRE